MRKLKDILLTSLLLIIGTLSIFSCTMTVNGDVNVPETEQNSSDKPSEDDKKPDIQLGKLIITSSTNFLIPGDTAKLSVKSSNEKKTELKEITWSSDNEKIVKISNINKKDNNTEITGLKNGTAKITATEAETKRTATYEVEVKDAYINITDSEGKNITGTFTLGYGKSETLKYEVKAKENVRAIAEKEVVFSIPDVNGEKYTNYFKVEQNTTAKTLTITSLEAKGNTIPTFKINLTKKLSSSFEAESEEISFTASKPTLSIISDIKYFIKGSEALLTVSSSDGNELKEITWSNSEDSIVEKTEDKNNTLKIKGLAEGISVITAEEAETGRTATFTVTVKNPFINVTKEDGSLINGTITMDYNGSVTLNYLIKDGKAEKSIPEIDVNISDAGEKKYTDFFKYTKTDNSITISALKDVEEESPEFTLKLSTTIYNTKVKSAEIKFMSNKKPEETKTEPQPGEETTPGENPEEKPMHPERPKPDDIFKYLVSDFKIYKDNVLTDTIDNFDQFIIKTTKYDKSNDYFVLQRTDYGEWYTSVEDFGRLQSRNIDYSNVEKIEVFYAPSYKLWGNSLIRKIDAKAEPGDYYAGDGDVLKAEASIADRTIDAVTKTVTLKFNREYTQIKILTVPNKRLRVNITNFEPAMINMEEKGNDYSDIVKVGPDGIFYLYGKWNKDSQIQIITQKYGELKEAVNKKLPEYKKEESLYFNAEYTIPEINIEKDELWAYMFYPIDDSEYIAGAMHQGMDNMCWAASSSQIVNWWQWQNFKKPESERFIPSKEVANLTYEGDNKNYEYDTNTRTIYDNIFKTAFTDGGFPVTYALRWFMNGELTKSAKDRIQDKSKGGYYADLKYGTDLVWDFSENYKYAENEKGSDERLKDMSKEIYANLSKGQPMTLVDQDHATTIWGAKFDTDKGIVTELMLSDSSGKYGHRHTYDEPYKVEYVEVQLRANNIYFYVKYETSGIVMGNIGFESLHTLFPTFGNVKYITENQ